MKLPEHDAPVGIDIRSVTLWLAMSPETATEASTALELIEDLFALLKPYGARSVWSSEPRTYHTGPAGRRALAEALSSGRIRDLVMAPPTKIRGVAAMVRLDPRLCTAGLNVRAEGEDDRRLVSTFNAGVPFLKKWFIRTNAASGFVSVDAHDYDIQTGYEAQLGQGVLSTWAAVQRFLRGVFWGMALGPSLTSRLGGIDTIARDAPAAVIEPLGHGVWLQATASPDSESQAGSPLATYLAPLLSWTRDDVAPTGVFETAELTRAEMPSGGDVSAAARRAAVPVRFARNAGIDTGLNIHFRQAPDQTARERVSTVVQGWYAIGVSGGFGGRGFHELNGPTVDGNVMRWRIDFGSASVRPSVGSLASDLGQAVGPSIVAGIVVGTEKAGWPPDADE